jgi:hypothetical protein
MLMRLHSRAYPFDDMPLEQVNAPAMRDAFAFFRKHDLLDEVATWETVKNGSVEQPFLSPKGIQLVERLCEVEP